jgi:hypothetical protein
MLQVHTKKTWNGAFFYGANCRKDEHGEVRSGFIPTENGAYICRNVKTTMEFSCQDIKNGNQITIQNNWLKYIDHMVGM